MNPAFAWNGTVARLMSPNAQQIAAWVDHLALGVDEDDEYDSRDFAFDDEGDDELSGEEAALLLDSEHLPFIHATWWVDPLDCPGPDQGGAERCGCGPISLLEVLEGVMVQDRQAVLDAHRGELDLAYGHYWSGDGLLSSSDRIHDACPDCLTEGAFHVGRVGAEAEYLAAELGTALAAFAAEIQLGAPRYDQSDTGSDRDSG
jgi:hypothetical protein